MIPYPDHRVKLSRYRDTSQDIGVVLRSARTAETGPETLDIPGLLGSWELHLRAERKSAETVKSYTAGVSQFLA